jgi:hypothetical protein
MSQLQLFDPSRCVAYGQQMHELFFKTIVPNIRAQRDAERSAVGGLSAALALVGDDDSHPDFRYLCGSIQKMGEPVAEHLGKITAYRYATDPKTAGQVAHLPALTQVQGFINQLPLGGSRGDAGLLEAASPNRASGAINFDAPMEGAKISPQVAGAIGEDSVGQVLRRLGIEHTQWWPAPWIGWGKTKQSVVDFKVGAFDQEPLDKGFYIEVKWRNRQMSADDNLTALLHNIESWYDLPTLILYDGEGSIPDAYERVRHQMRTKNRNLQAKVLAVYSFSEFVSWAQRQLGDQTRRAAA